MSNQCGTVAFHHPQVVTDRLETPLSIEAKRSHVVDVGVHEHLQRAPGSRPAHGVGNQGHSRPLASRRRYDRQALQVGGLLADPCEAETECFAPRGSAPKRCHHSPPRTPHTKELRGPAGMFECGSINRPFIAERCDVDAHHIGRPHTTDTPHQVAVGCLRVSAQVGSH